MTAVQPVLYLPQPLAHQRALIDSPAQFKIARCGRRGGKSRAGLICALAGHGQGKHLGVLQGERVAWVSPDYKQSVAIWREEIKPRFANLQATDLNESERRLTAGTGLLELLSNENIDALRGRGFAGVVVDEAAWLDLEYALNAVILPTLLDKNGWLLLLSTPNAAGDGNPEKRLPSYFNVLCEKIQRHESGPEWEQFSWPSEANPKLSQETLILMRSEYPADSPVAQQEYDAALVRTGTGIVFSEWREDLHVLKGTMNIPNNWRWAAGLDFGYRAPGCFLLFACGPDGDIIAYDELYFKELHAREAGKRCAVVARKVACEYVAYDSAMTQRTGLGPSVAEEFKAGWDEGYGGPGRGPSLVETTKGKGSRTARVQVTHTALAYQVTKEGTVPPWWQPTLKIHERCANLIRTLPALPYDPHNLEDVDTTVEDHPYDSLSYFLMSRPPKAREERTWVDQNTHPGFEYQGTTVYTKGKAPNPDQKSGWVNRGPLVGR